MNSDKPWLIIGCLYYKAIFDVINCPFKNMDGIPYNISTGIESL